MMRGSAGDGYESFTVFTSGAISGPGPAPPARTEYILSATDFLQLSAGPWFDDMCRVVTADGWWVAADAGIAPGPGAAPAPSIQTGA